MARKHRLLACVCGGLLVSGCEAVEQPGTPPTESSRVSELTRSHATGSVRLAPRSAWVRLNRAGPGLYSPRVSPDGRHVAAAGLGGQGLYVVEASARGRVTVVDASYRGPWAWSGGPSALHFGQSHEMPRAHVPARGTTSTDGARSPWVRPFDETLGELLFEGPFGRWYHHARLGTVTHEPVGGRPRSVAAEDAWGAVVSPEGRYAAYSKGLLSDSRFFVHDAARGLTREIGPGVHPVFLQGRGAVIYAVPSGVERLPGRAAVTGADLRVYDFGSGEHRALTTSPDLAEMEPALSPGGAAIVFSDWKAGGLWLAPLTVGGAP